MCIGSDGMNEFLSGWKLLTEVTTLTMFAHWKHIQSPNRPIVVLTNLSKLRNKKLQYSIQFVLLIKHYIYHNFEF